ncbi:MAG TPA: hypothetical protein IAC48_05345 [Candidatus Limiplasma stercoravium]|nr:hypothetical protein [Candidatus Limiplasma stercoravium]
MDDRNQPYDPYAEDVYEEEPIELGDVLEPYDEPPQDGYEDEPGEYESDGDPDEYSYEHQAADGATHFRVAMGVFNMVSILVGAAVILLLVAILLGLINWLEADILHSLTLFQSGLQ